MSSNDIAIRVSNLSKCYHIYDSPRDRLKQFILPKLQRQPSKQYFREFWALRDVSFEIKKGETVGIIGRNGSGKSTLLQLICGTLSPTGGSVETYGRIAALLELGSGFNPEFTGRENIYMNATLLGLGKEEIDARFDDIVAFADIENFIDQPVKTYSSGMMVRLAFAVQSQVFPDILIVDEALAVGDAKFQAKCFDRLKKLKDGGASILLVTHSSEQIAMHCNRALLLDNSKLLVEGQPLSVVNRYLGILFGKDIFEIATSDYFDGEWYLTQYPDIRKGGINPAEHYLRHGAGEMRDPGPLFNTRWYLAKNPEVSAMGLNPLVHFMRFGAKAGRDPSPLALLRRKICVSEQEAKRLFEDYANSTFGLPEKVHDGNCEMVKSKWTDYFFSKGAVAYHLGNIQQSLRSITSGIQVSPDVKDGYTMYHHAFSKLNHKEIKLFEAYYGGASLIVAHISCHARISLAESSALSFQDKSNQIRNLIVIGDTSLPESKFDFNPSTNILKVPSNDSYEALPVKIRNLFLFLGLTSLDVPVLKVDDDIHCESMGNLLRDLEEVMLKNDYGGFIVPKKPYLLATYWHLNKCTDPMINSRPDSLLHLAPFATGPSYWLGRQAVNALSKIALIHECHFETEIFEDRAVGSALAGYGFHAHHFNFIDSGSLKSIAH